MVESSIQVSRRDDHRRRTITLKKAIITGVTGQDGSFLAEFLLKQGYEVHGIIRRSSSFNTNRLEHIYADPHQRDARLFLHYGDLSDGGGLRRLLEHVRPHEVYNLAAQSHVRVSFDQPEYTADVVGTGTLRILEALRSAVQSTGAEIRFYQAGSSEMFGATKPPQNEESPFYPRSPYAAAKVAAHWYAVNYREAYGLYVCNGILFNHESERRGETFVTRKITRALTRIRLGLQERLYLGNLDARRDWGFAGDYVRAMWMMLQQEKAQDYVVATGVSYSVREFLDEAARILEMDWSRVVELDAKYLRPTEVDALCGDASKARRELGWAPEVSFQGLVQRMVEHDMELAQREKVLVSAGYGVPYERTAHG
ncbi:MAG: GDP-mannose 4,6-dehydratase [Bryobacteraceae bacterium]|nr:GDP-mannose 4,6-dehydratase [Bryobacteraceae bacterium]